MRFHRLAALPWAVGALAFAVPGLASADDAQSFIEREHHHLAQLLHEPESAAREKQIHQTLANFVDYDELTHRAFGQPCPVSLPSCENLWANFDDGQREELRKLLEQLVRKNYERNLNKTLDFDVTYKGSREAAGDTRVMTEAKNRQKPHEPAVRVDYVVKQTPAGPKVVDIITEGSSMTKSYYEQFRKKMHDPNEGYPNIVQKLREKIEKKD